MKARRPTSNLLPCALAALAALLMGAAPAGAHPGHKHAELKRVTPQVGPDLYTHGRDPMPPPAQTAARESGLPGNVGFRPGDAERTPVCATDYYQHVIYARLSSAPDRYNQVVGQIRSSIRRANAVLNAESLASGGPNADYKVLCAAGGEIQVDRIVTSGTSFSKVVSAARAAGFDSERADYAIFLDATDSNSCGIASYASDERLSSSNESNSGGGFAVIQSDCWDTEIPMHEIGHTMGAVQYSSPHSTGSGGHCAEESDVMCYSPDGGDRNQNGTTNTCPGDARFDCGFDDYFDSAPEPGEYLSSHWNLGSPLNRFIAFSGVPGATQEIGGLIEDLLGAGRSSGTNDGTAGGPGEWRMFEIEVTRSSPALKVSLKHEPGAALSLYVRRGKEPSEQKFACRVRAKVSPTVCKVKRPKHGTYIAGVLSRGEAGQSFKIAARLAPKRKR